MVDHLSRSNQHCLQPRWYPLGVGSGLHDIKSMVHLQSMAGLAAQHEQEVEQLRKSLAAAQQKGEAAAPCDEVG